MEGFKAIPPMAPAGVLDAFDASIGEVNTALVTFLGTEGTGVTRSELTQAWETYAPALLEKHRRNKVLKSKNSLTNENRRLKVKPSPRLAGEVSQGTINAMISALAETV